MAKKTLQSGNGGSNGPSIEFSLETIRGLLDDDGMSPAQAKSLGYVSAEEVRGDKALVTVKAVLLSQERKGVLESIVVRVGKHKAKWYRPKSPNKSR